MRLIIVAAMVGLVIGLLGTPLLIRFLHRHGYAQAIRDESDGHYPDHEAKRGTPSMGGLIIVGGTLAGYSVAHLYTWRSPTASGLAGPDAHDRARPWSGSPTTTSRSSDSAAAGCGPASSSAARPSSRSSSVSS